MGKVSGITKKNFKIGTLGDFEKTYVLYVAMAEKPLSSGQKWFLRWVFLGFGGYFLLQSVFVFSFRWSEVPFPRYSDSYVWTFWYLKSFIQLESFCTWKFFMLRMFFVSAWNVLSAKKVFSTWKIFMLRMFFVLAWNVLSAKKVFVPDIFFMLRMFFVLAWNVLSAKKVFGTWKVFAA